ncbi:MAG: cation:proton antiporter [Solirubrobacterales bacterium]|nr:cation:proton antiporter [Solirubrobacterales bacterium]
MDLTLTGHHGAVSSLAASPGFSFADPYAIGLVFAGLAVFAAIGALSHQHERAFSASLIYLALGVVAAWIIDLLGVGWIDPLRDYALIERLSELAVVIALFGTGLSLDRRLRTWSWGTSARLLLVAMPLTVVAVAVLGTLLLGLSLGAAILLGAILAPTDPVLAGDLGVGPPGDEEEGEPNFSITAEAGFNDGLAFPIVLLGVFVAGEGGTGWIVEWLVADVLYAVACGLVLGLIGGWLIAAAAVRLRDRDLLSSALDGWLAVAAVLVLYGLTEVAGGYGFLAAFAGGVGFRRYEHEHEVNGRVHAGAEIVEKFGELALILLLGSLVTLSSLTEPGVGGWVLVGLLLVVVRPAAVAVGMVGAEMPLRDRAFMAWFGVRGIGSLYYVAVVLGLGVLGPREASALFWVTAATIVASIVVHGVSATPLGRVLLEPRREPARPDAEHQGREPEPEPEPQPA